MEEPIIVTDHVSEMRTDMKKNRRRRDFIIGIVIIALAIVGFIYLLFVTVQTSQNILNNTRQKQKWEDFTLPVVMVDPVPFDNANNLEQVTLQEIAIYASLIHNKVEDFQRDEQDYVIIPRSEVDKQLKNLFGPDVKINHATSGTGFSDSMIGDVYAPSAPTTFIYDEDTQSYHINLTEILTGDMYVPKVMSIEKINNELQIKVGYMAQPSLWDDEDTDNDRRPSKSYMYTIATDASGSQYIKEIESIQGSDREDVSSTGSTEVIPGIAPTESTESEEVV